MAKNVKELLMSATQLPVAIEAMLPVGAPKLSTMLADATVNMPVVPDFPVEIPDLPAPPALPAFPGTPTGPEGLRRVISGVTVTPVGGVVTNSLRTMPLVTTKPLGQEILS